MKDLRARIATGDLLVTKWQAPQLPTSYVHRPRLLEQMHQAVTQQLALLSAPAGYGKTMLLAEWSASSAKPVAWLSLEPADNDPARFLLYLLATFQQIHPQIGETAAQQLDARHQPAQEAILTSIVNDLAANLSNDLILILDAYQVITHEAIHQIMTFVLEHLPPQVHLVIGTRMDPPWPLARWRAQGRLSELQSSDLRFSTAEVRAFLRLMHLDLSEQMQYQIAQRTEGWIAAVQLAALDAQHEQAVSAALLPSVRPQRRNALAAYLSEEILAQQPQALQDFLVQTSILTRLNGSLCDAVTGRQDSQTMLERLRQSNLFTEALDHEGGWYRYHPLFAEALRFHLGRSHPELVAVLHQRASAWYEQQGLIEEAIDHALLAHEEARVAALLETTTLVCFAQGRYATLLRRLEQLPISLLLAHPHLGIIYAWMLVCDERIEQAHAMAHMIERHLGELRGAGQDASSEEAVQAPGVSLAPAVIWEEVRREFTLLSATLALLQGEHARALALVHEILRTGKSDSPPPAALCRTASGADRSPPGRFGKCGSRLAQSLCP